MQIGEVARKMSQFDLDLKQDRDVVKGEQDQPGEKRSQRSLLLVWGFMKPIHKAGTASIQGPSMVPTRRLAQLP
jgi:hypothetical protein